MPADLSGALVFLLRLVLGWGERGDGANVSSPTNVRFGMTFPLTAFLKSSLPCFFVMGTKIWMCPEAFHYCHRCTVLSTFDWVQPFEAQASIAVCEANDSRDGWSFTFVGPSTAVPPSGFEPSIVAPPSPCARPNQRMGNAVSVLLQLHGDSSPPIALRRAHASSLLPTHPDPQFRN